MTKLNLEYLRSVLILGATMGMLTAVPAAGESPPPGARQLSAAQLLELFGGRTWIWDNGGAYFRTADRSLRAYSTEGGERTFAEGRFRLTNAGRLCLQAEWRSAAGDHEDLTCFRHVRSGATIYQRKERDGDWYVLVEDGVLPESLVAGDVLADEFQRVRTEIMAARR
jgi:hypothetical protein